MKRVIFLSLIMLAMLFGLVACKQTVKVGLIDTTGKIVIEPQFKAPKSPSNYTDILKTFQRIDYKVASPYFVGLKYDFLIKTEDGSIYVIVDGKCNLVDTLTAPKFDDIIKFSDILTRVKVNEKYGFVDTTGKIVVEPQFDFIFDFRNGFAHVEIDNKRGFVNKYGQIVVEPQFTGYVGDFYEGLASVQVDGKYGFIDTTGKMVIEPQFDDAGSFSDGLAFVKVDGKQVVIDKQGEIVFEPKFDIYSFSEGLALFSKNYKKGFINTQGEIVIEPQYDFAEDFKNGFALVGMDGEIKWYIDKSGNKVNDSTLQSILDKEPLSPVEEKFYSLSTNDYFLNQFGQSRFSQWWEQLFYTPNYGYVDKTGKVVIDFQFEEADGFYDGLSLVKVDGKYGFIDKTGKMVIEPQFDHATSFKNGYALIGMD